MQGHIRKKDSGWQFTVELSKDPITGKRKQKSKGGFKTKKDCQIAMSEMMIEIEKGEYFETSNMTLRDYLLQWSEDYAKVNVAPKTYERYFDIINKYIIPKLGAVEINNLKPLHIQSFYNYCIKDLKLSSTTVRQFHAILHKSLNQAVKWQLINVNITDAIDKPRKAKISFNTLNEQQVEILLSRLKGMTLFLPVMLALTTGMRRGELCGLKWENIDLNDGIIYVKNQLQKINGELQDTSLKTDGSKRKIIFLKSTLSILKEYRKIQLENKLKNPEYYNKNYVICKSDGQPYDPSYITKNFVRIIHKISIELNIPKVRLHDLRHTHATLLLKAGVNPKVVSERLGHSSVSMTLNTYSHVLPEMQQDAANKLEKLLSKL